MKSAFELHCDSDAAARDTARTLATIPGLESITVAHNGRVMEMHVSNAVVAGISSLVYAVSRLISRQAQQVEVDLAHQDTTLDDKSVVSR